MRYYQFPRYVSVAEKREKAEKKLGRLLKKNPAIKPVVIERRSIAWTWWGKSWNKNLERYADYSNRIGRGRSYVRHGAVLDLQIEKGVIRSLVQGSRAKPYSVTIKIKALKKDIWRDIKSACAGKLESLQMLLQGKFPQALEDIFMASGRGLFPTPKEIVFQCSCPDWAYMCKHVAATLYGVGARLDEDPTLFFILRRVKQDDLISKALEEGTGRLLKKAERKSARVIADKDLSDLFGIDLEGDTELQAKPASHGNRATEKKKAIQKTGSGKKARGLKTKRRKRGPVSGKRAKTMKSKIASEKSPSKKRGKRHAAKNDTELVLGLIKRSRKGVDVAVLTKRCGIDEKRIRNIIYSAYRKGIIKRISRGVYLRS